MYPRDYTDEAPDYVEELTSTPPAATTVIAGDTILGFSKGKYLRLVVIREETGTYGKITKRLYPWGGRPGESNSFLKEAIFNWSARYTVTYKEATYVE